MFRRLALYLSATFNAREETRASYNLPIQSFLFREIKITRRVRLSRWKDLTLRSTEFNVIPIKA